MGINVVFDFPFDLLEKEKVMFHLGTTELIVILVIVILLFGVGRIGKIASEIGLGVRNFREGLNGDKEEKPE
jgi:sec-independent protein translocase protein TatA